MNNLANKAIVAQSLKKIYRLGPEEIEILAQIDLEIEEGTTVLIFGESGSGKSTLLNLIGGLDNPTKGSVFIKGTEISSLKEDELSLFRTFAIGFIFQFHYLLKDFTALENIILPSMIAGLPKAYAKEKSFELLKEIGLEKRKDHFPHQLSGGERQRVAVARALINSPAIILADEPTGNLDEKNAKLVLDLLFHLVEKYKKTMILVSHDTSLSKRTCLTYRLEHGVLTAC